MRIINSQIIQLIILFSLPNSIGAVDNLKNAFEIGKNGADFQSQRINIISQNIANSNSIGSTPGGYPYIRKLIFAENKFNNNLKTYLIKTRKIDKAKSGFLLKYEPDNPVADSKGYVKIPNIKIEIEKADALEASRSYEANLSVMEISKQMLNKTLETIK